MVEINWDEIPDKIQNDKPDWNSDKIPNGVYTVKVERAEEFYSKSSKDPYWLVVLVVTSGIQEGSRILDRFFFSEKALPRFKRFYHLVTGKKLKGQENVEPDDVVNRNEILAIIRERPDFNDNVISQVEFWGYYATNELEQATKAFEKIENKQKQKDDNDDAEW